MCGTPEFVAPEVVNYDFIDAATGIQTIRPLNLYLLVLSSVLSVLSFPHISANSIVFPSHLSNPHFLALSSVQLVPSFPLIFPSCFVFSSRLSNLYHIICFLCVPSFPFICPICQFYLIIFNYFIFYFLLYTSL